MSVVAPPPSTTRPLAQRVVFGLIFAVLSAGATFYALTFLNLIVRSMSEGSRESTLDAGFRAVALPVTTAVALLVFVLTLRKR